MRLWVAIGGSAGNLLALVDALRHEGGRLGVARFSGEPLLSLLFHVLSAPVEVGRGYGMALRLLHQPLLVLKVLSLYLLGLLEELIV